MPRSRWTQLFALLLFALGVSAAPGWEVAHTLEHRHQQHEAEGQQQDPVQGHPQDARFTDADPNHQHAVFSTPIRPFGDSGAAWAALPSARQSLPAVARIVRSRPRLTAEARAGPFDAGSPQSRAPPLQ